MKKKRIGDVLLESGQISQQDLNKALAIQQEKHVRLGEALLATRVPKADVGKAIEEVQGVVFIEVPEKISAHVLGLIQRAVAVRCCALPLALSDRTLIVALADPQNLTHLDELRFCTGKAISPRFSFQDDIVAGIQKFYGEGLGSKASKESKSAEVNFEGAAFADISVGDIEFITANSDDDFEAKKEVQAGLRQKTVAVRIVSMILAKAAQKGASDIHIEPQIKSTTVRLRIDGLLREFMTIPSEHQSAVASRVKILANMDISERRLPQDGRFLMLFRDRRLDVRVSSLPTHFGEKVVMRILDPHSTLSTFEQLGFSARYTDTVKRLLAAPEGMIIVTGPTGSGKSTTLYVALNHLRAPTRNIITAEDPVEYMLDGVNQIQIQPKVGLTFASCLPSILRQDPDVIMVGEIRDAETAEIALRASQTGHLVLSTLHTNDSISAITRLVDLGIPRYLIGAVNAIVAQRLLRRLCSCKKVTPATAQVHDRLSAIGLVGTLNEVYHPVGCPSCEHTGYKGRVGVYELLVIDEQVRDAIDSEARPDEIRHLLRSNGFQTMQEGAFIKLKQGQTTLEEVMRVLPSNAAPLLHCSNCTHELSPSFAFCPFCGAPLSGSFAELEEIGRK